jgi:hypothetical protein
MSQEFWERPLGGRFGALMVAPPGAPGAPAHNAPLITEETREAVDARIDFANELWGVSQQRRLELHYQRIVTASSSQD